MKSELEARIVDLEIHVAHQADTIEALNDELINQQKKMNRLIASIGALKEQLIDLQDLIDEAPKVEKPPHY
ncbi:SlyX family protein [Polycladidibacter stylochi]|uniref:SlyX family protein n=1 Tax=Polycladidibacter stylochi TaxID=1807766 RepID=UPI00083397AB|nr:SlyX family protein [Pseudovibrio stylochi]